MLKNGFLPTYITVQGVNLGIYFGDAGADDFGKITIVIGIGGLSLV